MRVATQLTFVAIKKESLAEMTSRIRQAFLDSGLDEPAIRFTLVDSALRKGQAVDRVLKRYPELERFLALDPIMPGTSESRLLTNFKTGDQADLTTLLAILSGVPRSYPFPSVWLHFHGPLFGERLVGLPRFGNSLPGVWVNRQLVGERPAAGALGLYRGRRGTRR